MKRSHYFIAVPLTAEAKQAIARFSSNAAPSLPFRTWVHEEDYHITLAFLGDVPPKKWRRCAKRWPPPPPDAPRFPSCLPGLGRSGSGRRRAFFGKESKWKSGCMRCGATCMKRA